MQYRVPGSNLTSASAHGAHAAALADAGRVAIVLRVSARDNDLPLNLDTLEHTRVLEVVGDAVVSAVPRHLTTLVLPFDSLLRHFPRDNVTGYLMRVNGGFRVGLGDVRALVVTRVPPGQFPPLDYREDRRSFAETAVRTLALHDPHARDVALPVADGLVTLVAHPTVLAHGAHVWRSTTLSVLTVTLPRSSIADDSFALTFETPRLFALYVGVEGWDDARAAPGSPDDPLYRALARAGDGLGELRVLASNRPLHALTWAFALLPKLAVLFCESGDPLPGPANVRVIRHARPEHALLDFCATSQYMAGVSDLFVPLDYGNRYP